MYATLLENNENRSITIHLSKGQISNIDNKTKNRSKFLLESVENLIEDIENLNLPIHPKDRKKTLTISNPGEELNKKIYRILKKHILFISRAELYRFAVLYQSLMEQHDLKIQEKIDKENGIVRVPHVEKRIENCKTYKLVKEC